MSKRLSQIWPYLNRTKSLAKGWNLCPLWCEIQHKSMYSCRVPPGVLHNRIQKGAAIVWGQARAVAMWGHCKPLVDLYVVHCHRFTTKSNFAPYVSIRDRDFQCIAWNIDHTDVLPASTLLPGIPQISIATMAALYQVTLRCG